MTGLGGGYTCSLCGAWVPWNTIHGCTGMRKADPIPIYNYYYCADHGRVADALERIAKVAERALQLLERRWGRP